MWAFALALMILMWLWGSLMPRLLRQLAGKATGQAQSVWLAVVIAGGGAALLSLAWLVLPDSYYSHGWTREQLDETRHLAASLVISAGAVAFAAGRRYLVSGAVTAGQKPRLQSNLKRR